MLLNDLNEEPSQRFGTVDEFAAELQHHLNGHRAKAALRDSTDYS